MSKNLTLQNSHPYLAIKLSKGKGRGVFSRSNIKEGIVFLVDPIVFVPRTQVSNYIFEESKKTFLAMGMGSLINHSEKPNSFWAADVKNKTNPTIKFIAVRDILKDEEITHDYAWPDYPKGFAD